MNLKLDEKEIKKTGTTTVGLICKDGVVLAAEKKSAMGYMVSSKEAEKILPIDDRIVLTTAGVLGDMQTLVRYMKAELKLFEIQNKRKASVKSAATLLANILQGSKALPFLAVPILAGYDESGPSIFSLDPVGGFEEQDKFFSTGSGSPLALGVLEDKYKDGISIDEASKLALRSVKAAIERDIGSGGKAIDVAVITKDGIKITRHELEKISK
jgi:proteasome beta subunit